MVAERMVGEQPAELSVEEQNLLSVAHKNALGGRRALWRVTTSVEHEGETKSNTQQAASAREYDDKLEGELQNVYEGILALMDESLIPSASTGEPKVFYYKTKGDYYRFLAEFATGDPKRKVAQDAVDVPVVLQRQALIIQKVLKTVEVPQVQHIGKSSDVSVVVQRQVPIV